MAETSPHHHRYPLPLPLSLSPEDLLRPRGHLPVPLSSFVGREHEVAAVVALLRRDEVRLLTLLGTGGVGKTRLALRAAELAGPAFADGRYFVDLAPLTDPSLVLPAVARAVGVRDTDARPLFEILGATLVDRELLLVVDNVEHVLDAVPALTSLLVACPRVKLLATSRTRLRASGEYIFDVPPLALPVVAGEESLTGVASYEAVRLFVARAQAAAPDFALTSDTAPVVAEICRRLDGLPLALELAAARLAHLTPEALLARLEHRMPMLTGGARDGPVRQQTMAATIGWSHDLLTPSERTIFRRLAVFAGGGTLEAAEAICRTEADSEMDVLDGVASLVAESLIHHEAASTSPARYRLLGTVREYAAGQLAASGEDVAIRTRHAAHFLALAEQFGDLWRPDPLADFARISPDLPNLRAALSWTFTHGETTTFLRLAVALRAYWLYHGGLSEGHMWLDNALTLIDAAPEPLRAAVLQTAAWIANAQGDDHKSEHLAGQSLALFRAQADAAGEFDALYVLADAANVWGEVARARALAGDAIRLARTLGDPIRAAFATKIDGWFAYLSGDTEAAERLIHEAVDLCQRAACDYGAALALSELGQIAFDRGEHARAAELCRQRLDLTWLPWEFRGAVERLAEIAVACGEYERAVRLLGAAETLRERLGVELGPAYLAKHERDATTARAALGESAFTAAWTEGRRLSLDEIWAEGARVAQEPLAQPTPGTTAHGLTPRELEVLRLLAADHSNREIALLLSISERTVENHVRHILLKLGGLSRITAAIYAVQHDLT